MADNYLERRMEDYRSGRISAGQNPARRRTSSKRQYMVFGGASELTAGVAEALRNAGRVVYCADDSTEARTLAQRTGARHYPHGAEAPLKAAADCGIFDMAVEILDEGEEHDRRLEALTRRLVIVRLTTPEIEEPLPIPTETLLTVNEITHTGDSAATSAVCRLLAYSEAVHLTGLRLGHHII